MAKKLVRRDKETYRGVILLDSLSQAFGHAYPAGTIVVLKGPYNDEEEHYEYMAFLLLQSVKASQTMEGINSLKLGGGEPLPVDLGNFIFVGNTMSIDEDEAISYDGTTLTIQRYVNGDHYGTIEIANGEITLKTDTGGITAVINLDDSTGIGVNVVDANIVLSATTNIGDSSVGHIIMPDLPTSQPLVVNALYNASGFVKVSSGE